MGGKFRNFCFFVCDSVLYCIAAIIFELKAIVLVTYVELRDIRDAQNEMLDI